MEITWYGHSCFRLTERNFATVVTDPFDSKIDRLRSAQAQGRDRHRQPRCAGSQLYATRSKAHRTSSTAPGEFEIGGVFITGVQTDGGGQEEKG